MLTPTTLLIPIILPLLLSTAYAHPGTRLSTSRSTLHTESPGGYAPLSSPSSPGPNFQGPAQASAPHGPPPEPANRPADAAPGFHWRQIARARRLQPPQVAAERGRPAMQDSRRQEARDQRREATRDQRLSSGHSDGSGAGTGAAGSPTQGLLRDERVVRPGDMGVEMRSRSPELAVRPELVRDTGTVRSRGLPVPQGGKGRSGDGVMQYVHVTKKG